MSLVDKLNIYTSDLNLTWFQENENFVAFIQDNFVESCVASIFLKKGMTPLKVNKGLNRISIDAKEFASCQAKYVADVRTFLNDDEKLVQLLVQITDEQWEKRKSYLVTKQTWDNDNDLLKSESCKKIHERLEQHQLSLEYHAILGRQGYRLGVDITELRKESLALVSSLC